MNSCELFENGFGKLISCTLQIYHVKVDDLFHSVGNEAVEYASFWQGKKYN
jgi:hypothetical protein